MDKFAVIKSMFREEYKPFGGCFLVKKETSKFIWIEKPDKDGAYVEKIGKVNVYFYVDMDITETIRAVNDEITAAHLNHCNYVKGRIQAIRVNNNGKAG